MIYRQLVFEALTASDPVKGSIKKNDLQTISLLDVLEP